MAKPYIYLAFASDRKAREQFLESIEHERNGIQNGLLGFKIKGLLDYVLFDGIKKDNLISTFSQLDKDLQVFHFSGHANSLSLAFEEDAAFHAAQLATLFHKLKNLKLVFLNGCCTNGFVKRLHEAGVDAVLATSTKINDQKAAKFAIQFYESLAISGKTLERAFSEAAATLEGTEAETVRERFSAKLIAQVSVESTDEVDWGLYFRPTGDPEEDVVLEKKMLNWRFIDPENESIPRALRELLSQRNEKEQELEGKMRDFKKFSEKLKTPPDDPDFLALLQEKVNMLQTIVVTLSEEVEKLNEQIFQQTLEDNKAIIQSALLAKLKEFDHQPQYERFQQITDTQLSLTQAFIVDGTSACGHEILMRRCLEYLEIKSRNIYTQIEVSFQNKSVITASPTSIWTKVQVAMKDLNEFRSLDSDQPERIVEQIFEINKANHIVFVFKQVYFNEQENVKVFSEFWLRFLQEFKRMQLQSSTRSKFWVLLFLLDQTCHYEDGSVKSKGPKYQQQIQQQIAKPEHQPFLIPTINTLEDVVLKGWINDNLTREMKIKLGGPNAIIDALKGRRVLPAIHDICNKTGYETLFDRLKREYNIQFEITDSDQLTEEDDL